MNLRHIKYEKSIVAAKAKHNIFKIKNVNEIIFDTWVQEHLVDIPTKIFIIPYNWTKKLQNENYNVINRYKYRGHTFVLCKLDRSKKQHFIIEEKVHNEWI